MGDRCLILLKNRNFCAQSQNFLKSQKRDKILNFLHKIDIQISYVVLIFRIFGVTEVFEVSRLLQTVLFLTDSIFYVLFAYLDESIGTIGGYEPWKSWNTVDITPI